MLLAAVRIRFLSRVAIGVTLVACVQTTLLLGQPLEQGRLMAKSLLMPSYVLDTVPNTRYPERVGEYVNNILYAIEIDTLDVMTPDLTYDSGQPRRRRLDSVRVSILAWKQTVVDERSRRNYWEDTMRVSSTVYNELVLLVSCRDIPSRQPQWILFFNGINGYGGRQQVDSLRTAADLPTEARPLLHNMVILNGAPSADVVLKWLQLQRAFLFAAFDTRGSQPRQDSLVWFQFGFLDTIPAIESRNVDESGFDGSYLITRCAEAVFYEAAWRRELGAAPPRIAGWDVR